MAQNPHRHQPEVRRVASKTGAGPLGAKNFAQHRPSSGISAKKFARHAQKGRIWANLSVQGELFRACRRRPSGALPISDPAPLVWRAPEGLVGQAAVSVGGGRSTTGGAGGAEVRQYSPPRTAPGRCRYKIRPADPFSPRARDKIRPVDPFSPRARYKTRPARSKWPFLARFVRAG